MSVLDWVLGIGFILISLVGGVILGGIVGQNPAFIVAGLCFIGIGILALVNTSQYTAALRDKGATEVHILTSFSRMAWWGWLLLIALLVVAFGSFFVLGS